MKLDIDILQKLEEASGRNAKLEILRQLSEGKALLGLALDPNVTFGVTADERALGLEAAIPGKKVEENEFWRIVYDLLSDLRDRKVTGNSAKAAVENVASIAPEVSHAIWFARLINKDLRAGVQLSSLLKVWPGLVTPFEVQLALPYEPSKHELRGEWFIEPKLDGLRMVVIGGVPYTRNGKVLESVDHVVKQLKEAGIADDYVFDGEVMGGGEFDEASGKLRRKGVQATDAVYHVFDVVRAGDWASKTSLPFYARRTELYDLITRHHGVLKNVNLVESEKFRYDVLTPNFVFSARASYIAKGYEGVMLKDASAPYQFKRSKHLLKVKEFVSEDCEIVDMIEGRGKYKGKLGALIVKMPDGTTLCEVGSGFDDWTRANLWNDKEQVIGSVVEVQYQNKTPDGKMRFPVFLRFRLDKD